ncbi:hypothetical protein NL676_000695 [Syzygium grande]|nr:hypothetical protein NL676_000695 [Syzygium grande]
MKTKHRGLTTNGELTKEKSLNGFGSSKQFINSATHALQDNADHPKELSSSLEAAGQVTSYTFECNTDWGKKIGWMYRSTAEDILTGLAIHTKGWRSLHCSPNPPAFLGCAPSSGPASMTQQKRWATGLLEVLRQDPTILIPAAIFVIYNLYCLYEYFITGLACQYVNGGITIECSG